MELSGRYGILLIQHDPERNRLPLDYLDRARTVLLLGSPRASQLPTYAQPQSKQRRISV